MQACTLPVGPQNPAHILPPALLSRALMAYEKIQSRGAPDTTKKLEILYLLAIVFDFARNVFGSVYAGDVAIYQSTNDAVFLLLYDAWILEAEVVNGDLLGISLQSASLLRIGDYREVPNWKNLRAEVLLSRQTSMGSSAITDPIAIAAREVLNNCPYSIFTDLHYDRKWRATIVRIVGAPETQKSVDDLNAELQLHPRLVKIAGWCGGIVLHPCCRLGNRRQLRLLLGAVYDPALQQKVAIDPLQIINWRNFDGCTPLYIAALYRQKAIFDMLLEFGADLSITDNFGDAPAWDVGTTMGSN